jgi:hypothetical protein
VNGDLESGRFSGKPDVPYDCEAMTNTRGGRTVKAHGLRDVDDAAVIKLRARKSRDGDAARSIRRREARKRLLGLLGGSVLTPDLADAIEAEQAGVSSRVSRNRTRS